MKKYLKVISTILFISMFFACAKPEVGDIAVESVAINASSKTVVIGEQLALTATISPENATNKQITWTSNDEKVACVSSSGVVTGLKEGSTTITANASGKTATVAITVTKKVIGLEAIKIYAFKSVIKDDESFEVYVDIDPDDATFEESSISWESSAEAVAIIESSTVSGNEPSAVIQAKSSGKSTITVNVGDKTDSFDLTVQDSYVPVTALSIDKEGTDDDIVDVGKTISLTATITPSTATESTVTWVSKNDDVASVDENGTVTGVSKGTVEIVASCGGVQASKVIEVNLPVDSVVITKSQSVIEAGSEVIFSANVVPTDATEDGITWSSSDASIATVDSNGVVKGIANGTAKITATSVDDKTKSASVDVQVTVAVTSITLKTTGRSYLTSGDSSDNKNTLVITATVGPDGATNKTLTWTSSDTSRATVTVDSSDPTKARIKGVSPGKVTITATATDGSKKACRYTVTVMSSDFRSISGTTITGNEGATWGTGTSVFVSGRALTINPFFMCDHEVTRGEFKAVMNSDPSTAKAYKKGSDGNASVECTTTEEVEQNPVNNVKFFNAIVYCNKLSVKEGLTPCYSINGSTDTDTWPQIPSRGNRLNSDWNLKLTFDVTAEGYRLPTEIEWEWAAREKCGVTSSYKFAGSNDATEVAWFRDNTSFGTCMVKQLKANDRGLYDMSGNVDEMCWDRYPTSIKADTPATGSTYGTDDTRVVKGGGFHSYDELYIDPENQQYLISHAYIGDQNDIDPCNGDKFTGFRVCRNVPVGTTEEASE